MQVSDMFLNAIGERNSVQCEVPQTNTTVLQSIFWTLLSRNITVISRKCRKQLVVVVVVFNHKEIFLKRRYQVRKIIISFI